MVYPNYLVIKPGPMRLAACLSLAGFKQSVIKPAFTDAAGYVWQKPSELLIALCVVAGESSGSIFATHHNAGPPPTTDFGIFQINDYYNKRFFEGPSPFSGLKWCWGNPLDNAWAGYQLYTANGWKPWNAYKNGGYKAMISHANTWVNWADRGIKAMNSALKTGQTLLQVAQFADNSLLYPPA